MKDDSNDSNYSYIYTMKADGSDIKRITVDNRASHSPSWSPDGSKIAFIAFPQKQNTTNLEVFIINSDGTQLMESTGISDATSFLSWSPDGQYLVFQESGQLNATSINSGLNGSRSLTYPRTIGKWPNWSPVAPKTAIALMSSPTPTPTVIPTLTLTPSLTPTATTSPLIGQGKLVFVDGGLVYTALSDGTGWRKLDIKIDNNLESVWSPDGSKIVFVSKFDGDEDIYVVDADGSNPHPLTINDTVDIHPMWSSDGKQLAFIANLSGKMQLWVMDVDGKNRHRVSNETILTADWSHDGKRFVYQSDAGNQLFVMDADGKNSHPLGVSGMEPRWSPNDQRIVYINNNDIMVSNADGSNMRKIPSLDKNISERPRWSPDGSYITYITNTYLTPHTCYAVNIQTGAQVDLLPKWRPSYVDWTK